MDKSTKQKQVALTCPYCALVFRILVANDSSISPSTIAPIICECCGIVSLLDGGFVRKMTQPEYEAIQKSPAWEFIAKAQAIMKEGEYAATK